MTTPLSDRPSRDGPGSRTIARLDQLYAELDPQPLPGPLADRLRERLAAEAQASSPRPDAGPPSSPSRRLRVGVVAAVVGAGVLAAAAGLFLPDLRPDPFTERERFIAHNPGVLVVPLRLAEPADRRLDCGDVAWSPERGVGYAFVPGLPVNDPARTRYTLWAIGPDGPAPLARFDITDPVDQVVRLGTGAGPRPPLGPPLELSAEVESFAVTLDPAAGTIGFDPQAVVASSDRLDAGG